jgi:hypothetical protein
MRSQACFGVLPSVRLLQHKAAYPFRFLNLNTDTSLPFIFIFSPMNNASLFKRVTCLYLARRLARRIFLRASRVWRFPNIGLRLPFVLLDMAKREDFL